ncbi:UNVERIFIED_CONTAM: Lsr2 protein [Williamsia faeni]
MARKIIEHITDDFDGSELDPSEVIVETFTVNGVDYSLDLGAKSAEKFDNDMQKWIDKATKIGGRQKRSTNKQAPAPAPAPAAAAVGSDKAQLSAIREWARANGHEVSDRGRIPRAIVAEFDAAH